MARSRQALIDDGGREMERAVVAWSVVAGGGGVFEVKGAAGDWTWEIAVSAGGRLLEVEKERRPGR